jgi:ABC-type bacteriocin/lantibiotic exporter with double-glycine peptidase domain
VFSLAARDFVFYTQIPRYYLEVALVLGLGAAMGVTYLIDGQAAVLTSFGLLSGVAARAMPALSRALYSLTVTKVAGQAVLSLEPDLHRMEEAIASHAGEEAQASPDAAPLAAVHPDSARLVALDRVSFRYPTATGDALRDVSLALEPGELVAIVGESGAGKTTLVDVLIGLLSPQIGAVRRPGSASIGYVAQETFVWDDSVRFNVALDRPARAAEPETEIWASLEAARLADWVRSLPEGLDAPLGERGGLMSGGQRQRLGLARALYGSPSILVLDEPTSALDGETSRSLLATLVTIKAGVGIIVVTHDPIVVEYSDRTVTLGAAAGRAAG